MSDRSDMDDCVAAGSYGSDGSSAPYAATEILGSWDQSNELTLPANASTQNQKAELLALSCDGDDVCEAGGTYKDTNGDAQPIVIGSVPKLTLTNSDIVYGPPLAVVGSTYNIQITSYGGS